MNLSEPPESSRNSCADVAATDAILLRQAVEKLVRYGYKVGVTPEEMISLLYSGLSVRDMLEVVFRTSLKPNLSMIQRRLRVVNG